MTAPNLLVFETRRNTAFTCPSYVQRMALDITASLPPRAAGTHHRLPATPETVYWGYIDRDEPARLTVRSGDTIEVEAITHHAGDAPDLLMDDGIRAIWAGIAEDDRGPGEHEREGAGDARDGATGPRDQARVDVQRGQRAGEAIQLRFFGRAM